MPTYEVQMAVMNFFTTVDNTMFRDRKYALLLFTLIHSNPRHYTSRHYEIENICMPCHIDMQWHQVLKL